jgi:hypothetical protein
MHDSGRCVAALLPLESGVRRGGERQLEEENRLKYVGGRADAGRSGSERRALEKVLVPERLRRAAEHVTMAYEVRELRACRLTGLARATRRPSCPNRNAASGTANAFGAVCVR